MMRTKRIAGSLAIATVVAALVVPASSSAYAESTARTESTVHAQSAVPAAAIDAPTFSTSGGRYIGPTTVELTAASGTEIRYTLDGTEPTRGSALYTRPLVIEKTSNLAAVAFRNGDASPAAIEGYIIKTEEVPLLSFFMMSDIHTSVLDETSRGKWASHFDTLASINDAPDAILSNGDQINDNNNDTAPDHQVVKTLFDENIARLGLEDTSILMSRGNHDVRSSDMARYYGAWFPNSTGGYYEKQINGFTFLVLDTETYTGAQRTWLQGRLAALAAEPGSLHKPIFVVGHRPTTNTVHDGAQASNATLRSDLAGYPQAVFFSGHSHLNLNDERSIWQQEFTAVNDGSMSYGETPHDAYQTYGDSLWDEFTIPSAQSLYVEVYADRTEIDRVNYSAEQERTYQGGSWGQYQSKPPYPSAGTLAGPTWVVRLKGDTAAAVRSNFAYTAAARDTVAPVLKAVPEHRITAVGDVIRIAQATDDESVYGYDVRVKDAGTGALALPIRSGAKVLSDFFVSPMPAVIDIPLALNTRRIDGQPDVQLTPGTGYVADVTAVDFYGNRSETRSVEFVAGEDAAALPARLKITAGAPQLLPGEATTVVTTVTNQSGGAMTGASIALDVPPGWHAFAAEGASIPSLADGATRAIEWTVVVPPDAAAAAYSLTADARFTAQGEPGSISRKATLTTIAEGAVPRSRLSIAGVSSQETTGEGSPATYAIDGDTASLWHSQYSVAPANGFPHWITLDLGAEHKLNGLRYLPRSPATANGNLKNYEIHVSDDNVNWGSPVAAGAFPSGTGFKKVDFAETTGRYIRLTGLSAQNGLAFGAAAEIEPLGRLASPRPALTVEAAVSTSASSTAELTVKVHNDDTVPVDVKVSTAFGAHTFSGVEPGASVSHAVATGAAHVDAGVAVAEATAEISGKAVTRSVVAGYSAYTVVPDPVKNTTTTAEVVDSTVSTKENLDINATVSGPVPFRGKLQLFDGTHLVSENPVFSRPVGEGQNVLSALIREPASGVATGKRMYSVKFVSETENVTGSVSDPIAVEVYFFDSAPGTAFQEEISWLAGAGITTGSDGGFQPGASVSRQAMAAFLFRLKHPGTGPAPTCSANPFPDVAVSNRFCGEIAWLKTQHITTGFEGGVFKPTGTIDRQAIAAFLYRLDHPGVTTKPTCTAAPFLDVAVGSQFCGEIAWLKTQHITTGYDGNLFKPTDKVTRGAMAAFLYRLQHRV